MISIKKITVFILITLSVIFIWHYKRSHEADILTIVAYEKPDKVEKAIKKYGNINKVYSIQVNNKYSEYTPLSYASQFSDYPEVIEILIKNGAEVNPQSSSAKIPVMVALSSNKNPNIAKALLNNGAKPPYYGTYYTLTTSALNNPNPEVLDIALKNKDIFYETKNLHEIQTFLNASTQKKYPVEKIKVLIDNGLNIRSKDPKGESIIECLSQLPYKKSVPPNVVKAVEYYYNY